MLEVLSQLLCQNVRIILKHITNAYVLIFVATTISAERSSVDPTLHKYEGEGTGPGIVKYYFLVITRNNDGSPVTHGGAALVAAILTESGGMFLLFFPLLC